MKKETKAWITFNIIFLLFNIGVIIFRVSSGYWGNSSIQLFGIICHSFSLYFWDMFEELY